ncbi:hypothetical protein [Schlesneria sp. T3-172]|uniref:hypothetical protein n=1 Tax=Schlesneria sphaerica TaxID=3373610 RepID=UPI0037C4FBE6
MTDRDSEEQTFTWARKCVVAATILFAVVEWLLFEYVRVPYRPPYDMLTMLGQEKYLVFGWMLMILAGWLGFLILCWWEISFTRKDYVLFVALLICLITIFGIVIAFPTWPVTPFDLILH